MSTSLVLLAIVALSAILLLSWIAAASNGLIRSKNACQQSWDAINAHAARRNALLASLVEIVRQHTPQAAESMLCLEERRANAESSPARQAADSSETEALDRDLQQLLTEVGATPALQASADFRRLQQELADTSEQMQQVRGMYHRAVRDLNHRLGTFPTNLIGRVLGFASAKF